MRPRNYSFESVWRIGAGIVDVYDLLSDYESYPAWWPDVRSVDQIHAGDDDGIGMVVEYAVGSPLGYTLRFEVTVERLEPPGLIATASAGDLVGTGVWRLAPDGDTTLVRYLWDVATTAWWMNLLAPVAAPAFSWAHRRVMARGAAGLATRLGAPLLEPT